MLFFTPLRSVKKSTGLFAPLEQGPRQSRPSLAGPVTFLAASPSDNGPLSDAPLEPPRPRPPPGGSPPGSALHNAFIMQTSPTPSPTPPRSRVADRPQHRQPAPRSWVPWSRLRGCRRSTRPPSRKALRAFRRFAGNARLRTPTGCSGRTLGAGCLVVSSMLCGIRSLSRCSPARPPPPLRLRLRSGGSQV